MRGRPSGSLEADPSSNAAGEAWEEVERGTLSDTHRLAVPGGWLYRARHWRMEHTDLGERRQIITHLAVTFVPDPAAPERQTHCG